MRRDDAGMRVLQVLTKSYSLRYEVMPDWISAVGASTAVFSCGVFGVSIPILLRDRASLSEDSRNRHLSVAVMFGAGVFISAGFCHLLPDADGELLHVGGRFPVSQAPTKIFPHYHALPHTRIHTHRCTHHTCGSCCRRVAWSSR